MSSTLPAASPGFLSQLPSSNRKSPITYYPHLLSFDSVEPITYTRKFSIPKEGCEEIDLKMSHIENLSRFCASLQTYSSPTKYYGNSQSVKAAKYTIYLEVWLEDKEERRIAWPVKGFRSFIERPMTVELILSSEVNPEKMRFSDCWGDVVALLRRGTREVGWTGGWEV
jgi:exo-beta-1,3-glucanase (GH17 family)